MRKLFAAPLALFSSWGWAQQLVAVAPPSDSSGLFVVAILAIVGGLIFLKVKHPETFDKILGKGLKLKSAAGAAFDKIQHEISDAKDTVGAAAHTALPETISQAPAAIAHDPAVPGMTPAQALAYLKANYPELIAAPVPTPADFYAAKQAAATPPPATKPGPKFVNGQMVG